jgi:hypothetical protein
MECPFYVERVWSVNVCRCINNEEWVTSLIIDGSLSAYKKKVDPLVIYVDCCHLLFITIHYHI